jgi:hypothetical protein
MVSPVGIDNRQLPPLQDPSGEVREHHCAAASRSAGRRGPASLILRVFRAELCDLAAIGQFVNRSFLLWIEHTAC